jgi:hypothetical protein
VYVGDGEKYQEVTPIVTASTTTDGTTMAAIQAFERWRGGSASRVVLAAQAGGVAVVAVAAGAAASAGAVVAAGAAATGGAAAAVGAGGAPLPQGS